MKGSDIQMVESASTSIAGSRSESQSCRAGRAPSAMQAVASASASMAEVASTEALSTSVCDGLPVRAEMVWPKMRPFSS